MSPRGKIDRHIKSLVRAPGASENIFHRSGVSSAIRRGKEGMSFAAFLRLIVKIHSFYEKWVTIPAVMAKAV